MKSIVVAYDQDFGIGAHNDLLWLRDLPDDLKHFRDLTTGNVVIMGRKNLDSIGKPLGKRQNIVVTRQPMVIEGAVAVDSIEKAYQASDPDKEMFVIGGGEIYRQAIDSVDRIHATEVQEKFNADVFFPAVDPKVWHEVSREHHLADERNKYDFDFVIYDRI